MSRNRQGIRVNIKPETISEGDIIEIQLPDDGGITPIKRGIVAYVQRHGGMNHFLTQQGAVIGRYSPGQPREAGVKFNILGTIEKSQPMLDIFVGLGRI